jgi:type IV/VI secretion system ImpK/VasF family protein
MPSQTDPASSLDLVDLCEPLFQYVCMLNRIARNPGGEGLEFAPLQGLIKEILQDIEQNPGANDRLRAQFLKVRVPLIFFVDSMISESKLGIASQWHKNRLAYEFNELAGDEKFFDLLDETLAEKGPEPDERLAIFYTCIGLGFQGWYAGQAEYLRKKMMDLGKRIPSRFIDTQHTARVCPEAYQHVDGRDLVEAPGLKVATMAIAFGGLFFVALIVNFYLFHTASTGLAESLKTILSHDLSGGK